MIRQYWRLRNLILLPAVAIPIMALGVVAGVVGLWLWYGPAFALYPAWQWPFVPDCPLFALLFVPALGLILLDRPALRYNAWVAFGLIKYGTWTVFVWVIYWINSGENFTPESIVMSLSHLGMILEGLFLLSFLNIPGIGYIDWVTVAVCVAWYGLSDWMDYGFFQTYPHFDTRIVPLGWIQRHTIGLTILLFGLYAYIARSSASRDAGIHRLRLRSALSIQSHRADQPRGTHPYIDGEEHRVETA